MQATQENIVVCKDFLFSSRAQLPSMIRWQLERKWQDALRDLERDDARLHVNVERKGDIYLCDARLSLDDGQIVVQEESYDVREASQRAIASMLWEVADA